MPLLDSEEFRHKAYVTASSTGHVGFDFETEGLSPYKGAKAFLLGFTDSEGNKFSTYISPEKKGPIEVFFSNPNLKYCAHNAKFEMSFLKEQFGVSIQGTVWDTEVFARIERNNHKKYSLQACAERIGLTKHKPMLDWLDIRGNKSRYHEAPREIIEPYVEQDAWLSWELCRRHIEQFKHWDKATTNPIRDVVELELNTTKPLFAMESFGLLVDVDYCKEALAYEQEKMQKARTEFEVKTSTPFVDSRKTLVPIFDRRGIRYGKTDLGNASFTEESLRPYSDDEIVRSILEFRASQKRATAYWENFLELVGPNDIIHPSINQNRAKTGRMSISEPSCQNWATDDDDPRYPIRRAFVARPNCKIVSLDYSQMELRLMADEANDRGMIDAFKEGKDFHQETAEMAGVPRALAKNGRFAKLYGAGVRKVAETLGVSEELSHRICDAINENSPDIANYTRSLIKWAQRNETGYNYLGRRYFFDDGFFYKYPNYRIQGGCGEILRKAIIRIDELLKKEAKWNQTAMLIPIHDEIVLNIYEGDMKLIPKIKELMISSYEPINGLKMDVSVNVGYNFYDLEPYEC